MSFADRNRGERDAIGDIADREDMRKRTARPGIDKHGPTRADGDASTLEPKSMGVGATPSRKQHHIFGKAVAPLQSEMKTVTAFFNEIDLGVEADLDAPRRHLLRDRGSDIAVEPAQQFGPAVDYRHFRTKPAEDAGEFE